MSNQVLLNKEARIKLIEGVNILADAVKSTLGPNGTLAVIDKTRGNHAIAKDGTSVVNAGPVITKDGVSVAKAIDLEDPAQNLGVNIVRQAAVNAANATGDGTTTSTVLAQAIINEGMASIEFGANPVKLKLGIEKAKEVILAELKQHVKPCETTEDLKFVSMVSTNGDVEITNTLVKAINDVGKYGLVKIREGRNDTDIVNVDKGLTYETAYSNTAFTTDELKTKVEFEEAYLLIIEGSLKNIHDIAPVLDMCAKVKVPLLIMSSTLTEEVLGQLIVAKNKLAGKVKLAVIKSPYFSKRRLDTLNDISVVTGSPIYGEDFTPIESLDINRIGKINDITCTKNKLTFSLTDDNEAINKQLAGIAKALENDELSDYDKGRYKLRLAQLSAGLANISVGGDTQAEMKERFDRYEDALGAIEAAKDGGVIPGGGISLYKASNKLLELLSNETDMSVRRGIEIVANACKAPLRQIVINGGGTPEVVELKLQMHGCTPNIGYDARNDDYVDMFEKGIIDPIKVTTSSLTYAVSVATLLLTTNCAVVRTGGVKMTDERY